MARKPNISVLGSYHATDDEINLSYELGKALANHDLNVISGGQKGVMLSLCKGIYENRDKNQGSYCTIIGILPSKDFSEGNEFLDVAIPTGAGTLQNSLVPLAADIVVAIGGSAGTLAELSFAWQYKKPIGLLGATGWAKKLANQKLDERRDDYMAYFYSVPELCVWIQSTLVLNSKSS
jgi:uncharacterized protein (TIGR00725 family)